MARWRRTLALLAAASVAAVPLQGTVGRASALTQLADADPWLVGPHVGLVYLLVPMSILSASVLFLAPGLMLAVIARRATKLTTWFVTGLALSMPVVSLLAGVATRVAARPVTGVWFGVLVLALAIVLGFVADLQVRRGRSRPPEMTREDRFAIGLMLALACVTWAALAPKFLWESLNGDGAHAFESSRLLVRHAWPFWPPEAGPVSGFPGMTSMLFAFPNGWFLRLFGDVDAAVRAPFLLYLVALFASLLSLGLDGVRRVPPRVQVAVAIGLAAYALAMAFSATYNPYSADIALPATQDTLLMVCFLGAVDAWWRGEWGWLGLFAVLTYVSLPNGLILLGLLLVADMSVTRPISWRRIGRFAAIVAGCVVVVGLVPRALSASGVPEPGGEYGLAGTLRYFAFLQFTDWSRLLYIAIPSGIFPFFHAFRWPTHDRRARMLLLLALAYFLFFFVQAHIALHHFVPAMLLPVAAALRAPIGQPGVERRWVHAWWAAATIAVLLSLPRALSVHTDGRRVAKAISIDAGDYAASSAELFRHSTLLDRLFPYDWDPRVPYESYGGSPLVWNRYAVHGPLTASANYRLQRADMPPPAGMTRLASDSGAVLYVRDTTRWVADRARRPRTPAGSFAYFVPRSVLFRGIPDSAGPPIVDVVATLERMGIDMTPILARLGIKR